MTIGVLSYLLMIGVLGGLIALEWASIAINLQTP